MTGSSTFPNNEEMSDVETFEPSGPSDWQIIQVKTRVDSFNQAELFDEIRALRANGHQQIALNLHHNRFLSFPVIRFCVDAARELREGGGVFALVGCSERTKRHFEIYGSLGPIRIVRSEADLVGPQPRAVDL